MLQAQMVTVVKLGLPFYCYFEVIHGSMNFVLEYFTTG